MYYKLNADELKAINEISNITGVDYELINNMIQVEGLVEALKDLLVEYHKKEEEITDLQNDIENNYELKTIDPYEEYGISQRDFI